MTDTPETKYTQQAAPSDLDECVGTRVQEERVRLQLTQAQLAERLGISRTSANLYEGGKHLPRAEVLIRLDGLGADVLYILTGRKPGTDVVDLDVMAFAMEEVRRQTSQSAEEMSYRDCLSRAWPIYMALMNYKRLSSELKSTVP
ncbi:helix-turn-helix domain-containing protein [Hydrogenophaga sp.]|uniref:helix-turn-helix domain-containing protein n=1 Tax=Hydrogenophaga sp. TaxID=1904254 RepID=UPI00273608CA|nr:helix-turn-helix transcriptional regulator [Hydrogenophaga sp.]MDP3883659.1 helix-turn-helix transcriptional regulator [Hydrogenophaga sp.]